MLQRNQELTIETSRLQLRRLTETDAELVLRLTNEPSFVANIGDKGLHTLDDARQFLREGSWTCQERPELGQLLVEVKESGEPAGVCGLLYRPAFDLTDIGFAFLPEFWGQGYAIEAARAVMAYGHTTLGVEKIVGLTKADNLASVKVLEKLGLSYERTIMMTDDDPGTVVYA